jgi:hypothetical protein
MPLASKMLLQVAAQYIGQLTDIERGVSGGCHPEGGALTAPRLTE